jgi:hypothetical protein
MAPGQIIMKFEHIMFEFHDQSKPPAAAPVPKTAPETALPAAPAAPTLTSET